MFLDESAFDDADGKFKRRELGRSLSPKREALTAKYGGSGPALKVEDVEEETFGSAGGLGVESGSRARMLAQQRDIQLKNRQKALQSGGMIRSSLDDARSSADSSQFTPAARQFSAPKTVKDSSADAPGEEGSSEFRVPPARKPVPVAKSVGRASRFSDDDDDEDDDYRRRRQERQDQPPKARVARSRFDDEDDDDDDYGGRQGSYARKGRDERSGGRGGGGGGGGGGWTSASRGDDGHDDEPHQRRASASSYHRDDGLGGPRDSSRAEVHTAQSSTADLEGEIVRNAPPVPPNLSNMREFLTTPVPKACGVVQCYIRRNKNGTNRLFPVYSLYLKDGDHFLLCSKKRPNNKTSNYLISMGEGDLSRDGANYLGKLRSNFVGTEFEIFDNGHNPKDGDDDHMAGGHVRKDLGAVMYAPNVLGSRGPRKMQVAIPRVEEEGKGRVRASSNPDDSILARMKDRNHGGLAYLINKPPRWNEQVGAYVLNFNGRVTMASVKNFQLVDPDEHNVVVLQFGRVAKDEFTMDMQWPISPFQAFAITLSSFDSKIACD